MARRTLAIPTWILGLLALLFALLWIRSGWRSDMVVASAGASDDSGLTLDAHVVLRSEQGLINVYWTGFPNTSARWSHSSWARNPQFDLWERFRGTSRWHGFLYAKGFSARGTPASRVYVPYFAVVMLLGRWRPAFQRGAGAPIECGR